MVELWRGRLAHCPVCFGRSLRRFDCIIDTTNLQPTDILVCGHCGALINAGAYEALGRVSIEQAQVTSFYSGSGMAHEDIRREISGASGLLDFLAENVALGDDQTFLDFGAGRGFVAMAAAQRFKASYACEPSTHLVTSILEDYPPELARPSVVPSIKEVPEGIDVLFMWHALEHLPTPTELWQVEGARLNPGCVIFLQIPLFRPAHIVESHYVFYTESSLTMWAASALRANIIRFAYDVERGFLTMIAKIVDAP